LNSGALILIVIGAEARCLPADLEVSMADSRPSTDKHIVEVEFNQQQDVTLKRLAEGGKYGATDAEIIRNAFQEFLRQTRI
jgi:hypothetical protein